MQFNHLAWSEFASITVSLIVHLFVLRALIRLSWILSELTRDYWHYLCHKIPFLYRHVHGPHHKAYRRDYTVRSLELYRQDRIHHAITECLWMVLISAVFSGLIFYLTSSWSKWGSLYGVIHSLDELGRAIAGVINPQFGIDIDGLHINAPLTEIPRTDKVTSSYHLPHHDLDLMVAFSGVNPLFDQMMGTVRSYRKLTFGIIGSDDGLDGELVTLLLNEGAKVQVLPEDWSERSAQQQHEWLSQIDVLLVSEI